MERTEYRKLIHKYVSSSTLYDRYIDAMNLLEHEADAQRAIDDLKAQLADEQQRADRAVKDRSEVLDVKTKEGLSCSEWLMRTATAERKVKDLEAQLRQVEGDRT